MKKMISILLTAIVISQTVFQNSYATCGIDIDVDEIKFNEAIEKKSKNIFKQTVKDKDYILFKYNIMANIEKILGDKVRNAYANYVKAKNSKISSDLVDYGTAVLLNLLKIGTDSKVVREAVDALNESLLSDKLSEKEKVKAISSGKNGALLKAAAGGAVVTVGAAGTTYFGNSIISKAVQSVGKAIASKFPSTVGAVGKVLPVATGATFVISFLCVAGLVGGLLIRGYNAFYVPSQISKYDQQIARFSELYNRVGTDITRHNWIDKNLLNYSYY